MCEYYHSFASWVSRFCLFNDPLSPLSFYSRTATSLANWLWLIPTLLYTFFFHWKYIISSNPVHKKTYGPKNRAKLKQQNNKRHKSPRSKEPNRVDDSIYNTQHVLNTERTRNTCWPNHRHHDWRVIAGTTRRRSTGHTGNRTSKRRSRRDDWQ